MNVVEAVSVAEDLLDQFGLNGWAVVLDRSKIRFGCCRHLNHTISLSYTLVSLNGREEVEDVIRHEIAHALAGQGAGHSRAWKVQCAVTGARPQACYDVNNVVAAPSKYVLVCEPCGYRHPRHRRTKTKYIHRKCGRTLTWERSL